MRVLDLFCGAGGASVGLESIGLRSVGIDNWMLACQSHQANGHDTVCADLRTYPWQGSCDFLWASPPCQPFSAAGKHGGSDDPRDGMPAFLRAVEMLNPPVLAMENVKGITYVNHRWYLEQCVKELGRLGYAVKWRILNCADFGVPQTRQRLVVIARRDGGPLSWPQATHAKKPSALGEAPWVSMADALGWSGRVGFPRRDDLGTSPDGYRERDWFDTAEPSAMVTGKARSWVRMGDVRSSKGTMRDADQPAPTLTRSMDNGNFQWVLNTGRDWKKGGDRDDAQKISLDQPAPAVSGVRDQWQFRRPATTVQGDPRISAPGHHPHTGPRAPSNESAIRVTVAQAAVLQAFAADYVFLGSKTSQFQQVGNAVPPTLAAVVAKALLS